MQALYNALRRQLLQLEISPNPAHLALAELEHMLGCNFLLITQNIDNLHECAGNRRIIHMRSDMHSELLKVRCAANDASRAESSEVTADYEGFYHINMMKSSVE